MAGTRFDGAGRKPASGGGGYRSCKHQRAQTFRRVAHLAALGGRDLQGQQRRVQMRHHGIEMAVAKTVLADQSTVRGETKFGGESDRATERAFYVLCFRF
jgi:hypothetical protein